MKLSFLGQYSIVKQIVIKMKIDKDDLTSSDCFYPTIKANTYNEI